MSETPPPPPHDDETRELVVLVHGLLRTARSMAYVGACLQDAGFDTMGWNYSSTQGDIADHGVGLRQRLVELSTDPSVRTLHVVTHSMGGLVARAALGPGRTPKLGRVVMLAPPNQGSELARWLEPLLGGLLPLTELSDTPEGAASSLPIPDDVEIGVIAADWDASVSEEETHLQGERDHITLPGLHSLFIYQNATAEQVAHFLRNGCFDHEETR